MLFEDGAPFESLNDADLDRTHFIVDDRVANLYRDALAGILQAPSVLRIVASENAKSLDRFPAYVGALVAHKVRRGHRLIAIGGGVIQDIACFLAATLLRGLDWSFYPTTLLAQADSCIGSKSSINVGHIKNILGTFTPPSEIRINSAVLATLDPIEVRSGIGEMLKVHAIDGPEAFDRIATDYPVMLSDLSALARYVRSSLLLKRRFVEEDEFDQGKRRVMNYGHSFGHAIESATRFEVPHGIAVTIGMDMANYVAWQLGVCSRELFERMHPPLAANYGEFRKLSASVDDVLAALVQDKKNVDNRLTLILPGADGRPQVGSYSNDAAFRSLCAEYLRAPRLA